MPNHCALRQSEEVHKADSAEGVERSMRLQLRSVRQGLLTLVATDLDAGVPLGEPDVDPTLPVPVPVADKRVGVGATPVADTPGRGVYRADGPDQCHGLYEVVFKRAADVLVAVVAFLRGLEGAVPEPLRDDAGLLPVGLPRGFLGTYPAAAGRPAGSFAVAALGDSGLEFTAKDRVLELRQRVPQNANLRRHRAHQPHRVPVNAGLEDAGGGRGRHCSLARG
jgi:hypothetical protein